MSKNPYLQGLDRLSDAQRAGLKRCVGKPLCEADARALSAFYSIVHYDNLPLWKVEIIFAVVAMTCLWRAEERKNPRSFIDCLTRLVSDEQVKSEGLNGRLRELLDTAWHETDFLNLKLYRLVRRIKTNGDYPDFDELLKDLLRWDHQSKYIQLRWAREFFGRVKPAESDTDEQEANEASDMQEEETDDAV
ncbi:hypothetical protein AGMMS49957_12140 [Synergistales bacterium]|nr:hypothetical protein AGMMS49957_12140 [Synergistales bacterium]